MLMNTTFTDQNTGAILRDLERANMELAKLFPNITPERPPVRTVYGGARSLTAILEGR